MNRNRSLILAGLAGALAAAPAPAAAQAEEGAVVLYEREVFDYERGRRADPFRSLLKNPELGLRFEDLVLVGVLHNDDPARSVAVLTQTGSTRRMKARVGDRLGGIRIVSIHPRSVQVVVEELGVARRETLELKPAAQKGT